MSNILKLATSGVQGLHAYQPGKPIEELEREYGIKNAIKLASNENPLGANPALQCSLKDINRYPDGNGFILKKALAQKLGIQSEWITLGNGSNDVLELIARAFVSTEHNIIFSEHAFAVYPLITQAIGATAHVIPAKNWGHDLKAMQAAINEYTRLIFIANPNNPTGTWVTQTDLKDFLDSLPTHVLVVVDEAYFEYAIEHPEYPDSLKWITDYPNLIVTRTFSKAYGLAGLRVGYAIAHPDIANILNRIRQPFNVNSIALAVATASLNETDYLKKSIALNRAGLQQLTHAFEKMGLSYIPSLGNFLAVNVHDGMKMYDALLHKGVIVRPIGGGYGMPQHIRVSVGLASENDAFLRALIKMNTIV